ncbi:hypothetical protein H0H87_006341 [Tephrocybe sp. NHM501043]|nr:hypothetical protein H0H87_006341 [Tephrocybe sp. NHM501043]
MAQASAPTTEALHHPQRLPPEGNSRLLSTVIHSLHGRHHHVTQVLAHQFKGHGFIVAVSQQRAV